MTLKIAINAQLIPGVAGGTESVLIGLVKALGRLDGPEHFVLIGPWEHADWLKPYLGQNQSIVRGPKSQALKRFLKPMKPAVRMVRRATSWISSAEANEPRITESNGFYESLGCSVVHFPYQQFIASKLPAIFNPHDLQHVHYPQFFSSADVRWREVTYGAACRTARTVIVHSDWVKQDVIRHYNIAAEKVQVILTPPPIQVYAEPTSEMLEKVRLTHGIDGEFALYPAMTWEHKNHVRLLEALASLRDRGTMVRLVCTGRQTDFFSHISKRASALRLDHQIQFLGLVPAEHLRALYRLAQFTIFPTIFEGAGLPLVEAWTEGSPVACSAVTSLLEFAGDAALLFDPLSVDSIAEAVSKMVADTGLREALVTRGFAKLREFNWEDCGKTYRAVYRRVASHPLTEEDRWLLDRNRN